jgi:aspartate/methionine/tyrosine aminotransferase
MKLEVFAMERLQSTWENRVGWNVSESGVHPLTVEELVDSPDALTALLGQTLGYTQTNGTEPLRQAIAAMYPGATIDHIEVTNGGSEANCIVLMHLLQPGDEVVLMTPNYMQAGGLSRALGASVKPWPLLPAGSRWRVQLDLLDELVGERTRAILICSPNNPTGARLTDVELDRICAAASRVGAWVMSDEIYRGAERDGVESPTIWGRYDRAIVTSGLSKAYGLPGLRIGWIVGPAALVSDLWGVHDYTSIAPGAISDRLARIALTPPRRGQLLERTRTILNTNLPILREWVDRRAPALSMILPDAGAIAFVRYQHAIGSTRLIERLRDERDVLVVPGDHFDMDGYLRIGFGTDRSHLEESLKRIGSLLDTIPVAAAVDAR